jgi:hypothetical protein
MDGNLLVMEMLVAERLAEARAAVARERLLQSRRPSRPPLYALLFARLGALARRVLGPTGAGVARPSAVR